MRGLLASVAFSVLCAAAMPAIAGGAYRIIASQTAESCARACADDGLCIAWTLTSSDCALSAVEPTEWPQDATALGLSSRARASASLPPRPEPLAFATVEATIDANGHAPHDESEIALLGGLDDASLRPRLGSRRSCDGELC